MNRKTGIKDGKKKSSNTNYRVEWKMERKQSCYRKWERWRDLEN